MSPITVKLFKEGDARGLEEIETELRSKLIRYGLKLVDKLGAVTEIVDAVFIALWKIRESFTDEKGIRDFLNLQVAQRCKSYLRAQQRRDLI